MSWEKFIKIDNSIKIKNLILKKSIRLFILDVSYNNKTFKNFDYFKIFKCFVKTINSKEIINSVQENKLIISNFESRDDYNLLVSNVLYSLYDYKYINTFETKFHLSFKNILFSLYACKDILFAYKSLKKFLYISSILTYYKNIYDDLNKNFTNINNVFTKKYLAFNSSIGIECLFVNFFNINTEIETYSLTHGFSYVAYKKKIPIDFINGYNLSAKKVFVWGEFSKKNLMKNFKIDPKKIIVAGHPLYFKRQKVIFTKIKNCLVLLPRDVYDVENKILLKIIALTSNKLKLNVSVKFHPTSILDDEYNLILNQNKFLVITNSTVKDLLNSKRFDFCVTYNSTVYYEAMYYGKPCFRFDHINEDFKGLKDIFHDDLSLISLLYETSKDKNLDKKFEELLLNVFSNNKNVYELNLSSL